MKRLLAIPFVCALLAGLALTTTVGAEEVWEQQTRLVASDGTESSYFGESIWLSGDLCAVGASRAAGACEEAGAVYIYHKTDDETWPLEAKLFASDGMKWANVGEGVVLSGNLCITGACGDDSPVGSGSAYIFRRNNDGTWVQEAKLQPPIEGGGGVYGFGRSVGLDGSLCVVGAVWDSTNGPNSGAAYVYRRDTVGVWTQETKLLASDGLPDDFLGCAVSMSGETCVIGAYGDDDSGQRAGSVFVFRRNPDSTWTQEAKLLASDGVAEDEFGGCVNIQGNLCAIGAKGDDDGSGSVYLFERNDDGSWSQQAKLVASDRSRGATFGWEVSLSGDVCAVGAMYDTENGTQSGAAYIFRRNDEGVWTEEKKLLPSAGNEWNRFGSAVSVSGDKCAVGEWFGDGVEHNTGAAYVFEGPPLDVYRPVGDSPLDLEDTALPTSTRLLENRPNPFNPSTTVHYSLSTEAHVSMVVYTVFGQKVCVLVSETMPAGHHAVMWNGLDGNGDAVASGVYLIRMTAGDYAGIRRMTLVK